MRSEVLNDWPKVLSLKGEWNGLLSVSHGDTIFLTWEWIRSWIEVVGKSVRPFVVSVRDAHGALVGVAPFYLGEFRLLGTVPYPTLRIMADYATGSEYSDWIVRKGYEREVCRTILRTLAAASERWGCIWMPNVAGWTGAHERIIQTCQEEGFYYHVRSKDFSYLELPDDMELYMGLLSPNRRSLLRRQMKKILGRSGMTITRCRTMDELPQFLGALFDLHQHRRKSLGEEGTFRRKPSEALFYRKFTPNAMENGWLRLFGLQEDGRLKAVQIGYVYKHIFHQLQEGFDPGCVPGIGNVLRAKVIEACIAEGIKAYDFLGQHTEHKRRWLAKQRTGYDFLIGHRSVKNRILFVKEIWPTGRFLRAINPPTWSDTSREFHEKVVEHV